MNYPEAITIGGAIGGIVGIGGPLLVNWWVGDRRLPWRTKFDKEHEHGPFVVGRLYQQLQSGCQM